MDQNTYKATGATARVTLRATECIPLLVALLIPMSVHAGLFSSLTSMWGDEVLLEKVTETTDYSARYTPLLSSTLNPDPLKSVGGGDIAIEDGALVSTGPVGADEIAASHNGGGEISVYVVREGDALSQIAEMYGVTTNTILWANDIAKASDIQPGDTLVILPIVGVQHTVAKNETLGSILKKYGANLEEVLDYNNLATADALSVGDVLIIPGGEIHMARTVASSPTPTKSSGTTGNSGLSHPVPGATRTQGIHGYNGVDLAAAYGTAIRAAAAGEVLISKTSGWNGGYGQYIVIRHSNGMQTLYAHLSSNAVGVGEYVAQGQTVGGMGSTGKSTGNHLHFEVRGGTNSF